MSVLLSYIVPIHNVEKYLHNCIDSIYAQGLAEDEFEIICIDDCSPDKSVDIVRHFQKRHDNIKLIQFERNRGLSAARNAGLKAAVGEYVWFVDSDDFIGFNTAELLLERAENEKLDVLLFNYCDYDDANGITSEPHTFTDQSCDNGIAFVKNYFGDSFVYHLGYVWRMLIRREYLINNDISFPEGEYWEDTVFFPKTILCAERVGSMDLLAYYYRKNPESISGGKNDNWSAKKVYDYCFKAGVELYQFSKTLEDPALSLRMQQFALSHFINSVGIRLLKSDKEATSEVLRLIKDDDVYNETERMFSVFNKLYVSCGLFRIFARGIFKLLKKIK